MRRRRSKSNVKVTAMSTSFYAEYRVRSGAVALLREDTESPPEALLQSIWQHQRLRREALKTLDGDQVRILHPGFKNVEGGPDFRGAAIQIGDGPMVTGDIEVDLRSSGWHAHGHDRNPAFKNVILQAVWESERPAPGGPPMLPLRTVLDAPLGELSLWLGSDAAQELPAEFRGKCCAPLKGLADDRLRDLLHQAAHVRLRSKASLLHARARETGWEQALWEGLFRALGYKHNVWPMQRLGELRARWGTATREPLPIEARLFGIGGLLPAELSRTQAGSDRYLRRIWDLWWRERDEFSDCLLPKALWRMHGLRPANHPHRRLALASRWMAGPDLPNGLEQWCAKEIPERHLAESLLTVLEVAPDDYWNWHYTLRSPKLARRQPLLGATRVTDLAVNVILPWLWIRASEGKNSALQARVEQRYFAWPSAEDNSLLRLARQRLLGGVRQTALKGAAAQQGLIQMIRDFCERTNSLCDSCKLPGLVESFVKEK
jgi:hypothetical protein